MDISIVIRTLNEKDRLAELLDKLDEQEFAGRMEIIVVDNDSTDGTPELARAAGATIINISKIDFSYPKSMNIGVAAAHNEAVLLTVGHALPLSKKWLQKGARHFEDPQVAGVFSPVVARKDGTFAEKVFYGLAYAWAYITGVRLVNYRGMGIMGATNCIIRKSLWAEHNFDENFGRGGEDGEWAAWAISKGYKIIRDPGFTVRHSHGNDWRGLIRQKDYWGQLGQPSKFSREALDFRKDIHW